MDKLVADRAAGPTTPKHRLVPIEVFLADSAEARLNRKRQWLPFPTGFSDTHKAGV